MKTERPFFVSGLHSRHHAVLDRYGDGADCKSVVYWPSRFDSLARHQPTSKVIMTRKPKAPEAQKQYQEGSW